MKKSIRKLKLFLILSIVVCFCLSAFIFIRERLQNYRIFELQADVMAQSISAKLQQSQDIDLAVKESMMVLPDTQINMLIFKLRNDEETFLYSSIDEDNHYELKDMISEGFHCEIDRFVKNGNGYMFYAWPSDNYSAAFNHYASLGMLAIGLILSTMTFFFLRGILAYQKKNFDQSSAQSAQILAEITEKKLGEALKVLNMTKEESDKGDDHASAKISYLLGVCIQDISTLLEQMDSIQEIRTSQDLNTKIKLEMEEEKTKSETVVEELKEMEAKTAHHLQDEKEKTVSKLDTEVKDDREKTSKPAIASNKEPRPKHSTRKVKMPTAVMRNVPSPEEDKTDYSDLDPRRKGDYKVLIIEDETSLNKLLIMILDEWGINTESLSNGQEAIHKLKDEVYDLVLTDIFLPGALGIDVYKECQKMNNKSTFIFLSGHPLKDEWLPYIKESGGFVQKPYTVETIEEILEKYFPENKPDAQENKIKIKQDKPRALKTGQLKIKKAEE